MKTSVKLCLLAACMSFAVSASAGVNISGTRLIYHGDNKEASINVRSGANDKYPYLIQSFVDRKGPKGDEPEGEGKLPFTVTPPLFRLEPGAENAVRVIRTGGNFPQDQESVYWLDIKAIPANDPKEEGKNVLRFSLKNRIKLYYRPAGLADPTTDAYKAVSFRLDGNQLVVTNPTPWYITFYQLKVGTRSVDTKFTMVAPHGTHSYQVPNGATGKVTWSYINDYGAASPVLGNDK